ncbi:YkgJ family cysteine cluster protein [Deltaproteobacteria bacterium TL4]
MSDAIYPSLKKKYFSRVVFVMKDCLYRNQGALTEELLGHIQSFYQLASQLNQELLKALSLKQRSLTEIVCQAGCDDCCGMIVFVALPEFHLISRYLHQHYTPEELKLIKAKLEHTVQRLEKCATPREQLLVKCSFLENGRCQIYPVRPFSCRAWNSTDVKSCRQYLYHPDILIPTSICYYAPYDVIKKGILHGLKISGYEQPSQELNMGMLERLNAN